MFYVYVLKSEKNGYRYVGQTNNLLARIDEHNSGKTKAIKYQISFRLIYKEEYQTRVKAIRREKFLKSGKGRDFLDRVLGLID